MKLPELSLFCGLALLAGQAPAQAAPNDLPALFGPRVVAPARFPTPVVVGDFDGDGLPDQAYLVTIKAGSATAKLAPDVTVNDKAFGVEPLGENAEDLALAIVPGSGKNKTLLPGYQGKDSSDFFGSPMWAEAKPPLGLAKRGSKIFAEFKHDEKAIRYDVLVVGTEAGIDMALYWTGKGYALFAPDEEP